MTDSSRKIIRNILFLLSIGLMIFLMLPAIKFTIWVFQDPTENMSYGWLIPIGSLTIIASRWKKIRENVGSGNFFAALPILLLAGLLVFFGERGGQARLSQLSFVCLFFALPLAFYGKSLAKKMVLPALFLVFILPVGFLDSLTLHLRMVTVVITSVLLNGVGIAVQNVGTAIHSTGLPSFHLDIADPCSGIRSLIAIMAFTTIYGEFTQNRIWKKWVLFASSLPIAMLGNVIRLMSTGIVANFAGQDAGMKLHDHALFLIAPVTFILVFAISDALNRIKSPRKNGEENPEKTSAEPSIPIPNRPKIFLLAIVPVFLAVLALFVRTQSPAIYLDDSFVAHKIPEVEGYNLRIPVFCQNKSCLYMIEIKPEQSPSKCPICENPLGFESPAEKSILPGDTKMLKATYSSMHNDAVYSISIVISGTSRQSIHRPEMCLPAQGYTLSVKKEIPINLTTGKFDIATMQVVVDSLNRFSFAYWFFNTFSTTSSHWTRVFSDVWERSIRNRINRWVMITVKSNKDFTEPDDLEAFTGFMEKWYPQIKIK